jgi:hypothetical protein
VNDLDALLRLEPMRPVWSWALTWFRSPAESASKRAQQACLIATLKAELRSLRTPAELDLWYTKAPRRTTQVARWERPRHWSTHGIRTCTATAYALRYVELLTGADLDPRDPLPRWVDEWCM